MVDILSNSSLLSRTTCIVGSLSLSSVSFGLLRNANLDNYSLLNKRLVHMGLLGLGISSLTVAGMRLIR